MKLISKTTACLCALIMAGSALSVIGVSAAQSEEQSTSASQSDSGKKDQENTKRGKVTAVNGSELTIALGEFAAKTKSSDGDSSSSDKTAEEKKSKSSDSDSSQSSSDDSTGSTEKRSGKKRGGKGRHHRSFVENGTTVTVTVTDSVTVKKDGEAASISDISEGDIVKLEYDDNGELVGISLRTHKKGAKKDASAKTTEA